MPGQQDRTPIGLRLEAERVHPCDRRGEPSSRSVDDDRVCSEARTDEVRSPSDVVKDCGFPLRILVVDDNRATTESLTSIFDYWGHEVRPAFDGEEALEIAREFLPEVILLDLGLPGLDGLEVARRLRGDPGFEETTILAMTGYYLDDEPCIAKNAGIDRVLLKPLEASRFELEFRRIADSPRTRRNGTSH
ncbi:MAG: response regulator [Isosphaeraceae bacterium]